MSFVVVGLGCERLTDCFFFRASRSPDGLFKRVKKLEAESILLAGTLNDLAGV